MLKELLKLLPLFAAARREPHPRSDHYRNLEKQARSARAGIWQNGR